MNIPILGGLIGRLTGNQEARQQYKPRSGVGQAEPLPVTDGDVVDLSSNAPQPLPARLVEEARAAADRILQGEPLSSAQEERLREDRVFAAVVALQTFAGQPEGKIAWPGGLPVPTRAEMEEALRRVHQRIIDPETARIPAQVGPARRQLLDELRGADLGAELERLES